MTHEDNDPNVIIHEWTFIITCLFNPVFNICQIFDSLCKQAYDEFTGEPEMSG